MTNEPLFAVDPDAMSATLFFLLGLLMGSFYNVVALRVPLRQSIVSPPSHCFRCARRLTAPDLVPVLSYIALRGRCRRCGAAISPLYPIGELLGGALFAIAYALHGWRPETVVAIAFFSYLLIFALTDAHYRLIPNRIIVPAFAVAAVLRLFFPALPLLDYAIGGVAGFLLPAALSWASRGGMGGGDVKLLALVGLFIGWKKMLLTLVIASLAGVVYALGLALAGRYRRKMAIPFAPFIALAAVAVYGWGEALMRAYWRWLMP